MSDDEAYTNNSELRHWYDKLWLSNQLMYRVGTEVIPCNGLYIVRPIMNLAGSGIDAVIQEYRKNDRIPNNCFWSEVFIGDHVTIDYTRVNGQWQQGHTFMGYNHPTDLIHFSHWTRVDYSFSLPSIFDDITASRINIEIIDNKIIEVHLRHNTDPVMYDNFIPIWSIDQKCPQGYVKIQDAEQHIDRLGFFVNNRDQC